MQTLREYLKLLYFKINFKINFYLKYFFIQFLFSLSLPLASLKLTVWFEISKSSTQNVQNLSIYF